MKYTVVIQWSEEDCCFVSSLPEFSDFIVQPVTHGDTYEEALQNAQEVLTMVTEVYQLEGRYLPEFHDFSRLVKL